MRFVLAGFFDLLFFGPISHTFDAIVETSDLAPTAAPASVNVVDTLTGTAVSGVDYTAFPVTPWVIPMGTPHGTLFSSIIAGIAFPPFAKTIIMGLLTPVGCSIGAPGTYVYMYDGISA